MTVRVIANEVIVPHGTSKTSWWLRVADEWCSVRDVPGVLLTRVDAGPQRVWETLAELRVAPGAQLMRVRQTPEPEPARDPMSYLENARLTTRTRLERHYFTVDPDGKLRRSKAPEGLSS